MKTKTICRVFWINLNVCISNYYGNLILQYRTKSSESNASHFIFIFQWDQLIVFIFIILFFESKTFVYGYKRHNGKIHKKIFQFLIMIFLSQTVKEYLISAIFLCVIIKARWICLKLELFVFLVHLDLLAWTVK